MRAFASITLLAAASVLAACAPAYDGQTVVDAAARPERQCFDADLIDNFSVSNTQTIYVREHQNRVFQLDTAGACTELDSTFGIALVPGTGSVNRLCTGDWTNVLVRGSTRGSGPCRARVTRMLDDEEVAALPERDRP